MSSVVHMWPKRYETALREIKLARQARGVMDHDEQIKHAYVASESVRLHICEEDDALQLYARASCLEVDGMLSDNRLPQARERALQLRKAIPRSRRKTIEAFNAELVELRTRELCEDPVAAMREFAALAARLLDGGPYAELEALLALRQVISSALRAPEEVRGVDGFVLWAVKRGENLARRIAINYPSQVADFRHWSATAEARLPSDDPARSRQLVLRRLEASLAHAPETPREMLLRGMTVAEHLLASGDRDAAIDGFDVTVRSLAHALPRHHENALVMLQRRELSA